MKANIKPEFTIKEHERYLWVWRCARLTNIPGQPRQDVREWNYVAQTKKDSDRFARRFRAANVHEAFMIHDGERQRKIDLEQKEIQRSREAERQEYEQRKKPAMTWKKSDMIAYAESEGIEIDETATRAEIYKAIK